MVEFLFCETMTRRSRFSIFEVSSFEMNWVRIEVEIGFELSYSRDCARIERM